jgi:glycosyltransferase involved in cell wall biosynthesis
MTRPHVARAATRLPVLFVNTATRPPLGADTWVHLQIMRALDRSTHEPITACAFGTPESPTPTYAVARAIPGLELVRVNFGEEMYAPTTVQKIRGLVRTVPAVAGIARLARLIRTRDVKIIHTSDRPRDAAVCTLLARLTRAKCIIHVHVAYGEWMSPMLKKALLRADALVAVSEFVKQTLVASGHRERTTHVVLNASDAAELVPGVGRDDARSEFGAAPDDPVIITVCRLYPAKGVDLLVEAMAAVVARHPTARLIIVGQETEPNYQATLQSSADRLGIGDRLTFTGRRDDVARLMAGADIFAMPSFEEPFGLVFTEAMALRLPVVALNSGGAPEIIEHESSGLLAEPDDVAAVSEHLLRLIKNPTLRRDMGDRGRQRVEEQFTVQRMAADVATVYALVASQ